MRLGFFALAEAAVCGGGNLISTGKAVSKAYANSRLEPERLVLMVV